MVRGSRPCMRMEQGSHCSTPPPVENGQLPVPTPPKGSHCGVLALWGPSAQWTGRPREPESRVECVQTPSKVVPWLRILPLLVNGDEPAAAVGFGACIPQRGWEPASQKSTRLKTAVSFRFPTCSLYTSEGLAESGRQGSSGALTGSRCPGRRKEPVTGRGLGLMWGHSSDSAHNDQAGWVSGALGGSCCACHLLPLGGEVTLVRHWDQRGIPSRGKGRDPEALRSGLVPASTHHSPTARFGDKQELIASLASPLGPLAGLGRHPLPRGPWSTPALRSGSQTWESPPFPVTCRLTLNMQRAHLGKDFLGIRSRASEEAWAAGGAPARP